MMNTPEFDCTTAGSDEAYDAILIGGGIMSATLGMLLSHLQPDWSILVLERLDGLTEESSAAWNNAGTGHAGLCEPNYMPDPSVPDRAEEIGHRFTITREFWTSLVTSGDLPSTTFLSPTPHMTVAFGRDDVTYLRTRFETLRRSPLFAAMEYSEDPDTIARWAPLIAADRSWGEPVAATRHRGGYDVDFGAVGRAMFDAVARRGATIRTGHEARALRRDVDGVWTVTGRRGRGRFSVRSRFVFVGAGGHALTLLQKARIPEVRGHAVFPIGAQFLHCDEPEIVEQHRAKVYGRAAVGAPPMSVPHLDLRVVDGRTSLMFGPFATFDTRLLRYGRWTDLFATVRWHNIVPMLAVAVQNLPLVRYLIGELLSSRTRKLTQLRRFVPAARDEHWRLVGGGQRAQLITPDPRRLGVLAFGTEIVTGADGTVAGLLGASPGASVAPTAMVEVLERCFPDRIERWAPTLHRLMPGLAGSGRSSGNTGTAR